VAARLDLADGLDSDGVERLALELDRRIREVVPAAAHVFLDPTNRGEQPVSATS
jgi:hypothetical protein